MNLNTLLLFLFLLLIAYGLSAQTTQTYTFGHPNGYGVEKTLGGVLTADGTLGSIYLDQRPSTNLFDLAIDELDPNDGTLLNTLSYPLGVRSAQAILLFRGAAGAFSISLQDYYKSEVLTLYFSSIEQLDWVRRTPFEQELWTVPLKNAADSTGGVFLITQTKVGEVTIDSLFRINTFGDQVYGIQLRTQVETFNDGEDFQLAPEPDGSIVLSLRGVQNYLLCKFNPTGGMVWETALEEGAALPQGIAASTPVGLLTEPNAGTNLIGRTPDDQHYWLTFDTMGNRLTTAFLEADQLDIVYFDNQTMFRLAPNLIALGRATILSYLEPGFSVIIHPPIGGGYSFYTSELKRYSFDYQRVHLRDEDVMVSAFSSEGDTLWSAQYGESVFDHQEWFADAFVDPATKEVYTFTAHDLSLEGKEAVILKTDSLGEVISVNPVLANTPHGDKPNPCRMIRLENGAIAYTHRYHDTLFLTTVDGELNELNQYTIPGISNSDFLGQNNPSELVLRTITWNGQEPVTEVLVFDLNQNRIVLRTEVPDFNYNISFVGTLLTGDKLLTCGRDPADGYGDHDIMLIMTDLNSQIPSAVQIIPATPGEGYFLDAVPVANGSALVLVKPFALRSHEGTLSLPYLLRVGNNGQIGATTNIFPLGYDELVSSAEIHWLANDTLALYYAEEREEGAATSYALRRMKIQAGSLTVVTDELLEEGAGRLNLKAGGSAGEGDDFVAGSIYFPASDDGDLFHSFVHETEANGVTQPTMGENNFTNAPLLVPNPAVDQVALTFAQPQTTEVTVRLVNRDGRDTGNLTFMQADEDSLSISLEGIPHGIYTVLGTRPDGSVAFTSRLVRL